MREGNSSEPLHPNQQTMTVNSCLNKHLNDTEKTCKQPSQNPTLAFGKPYTQHSPDTSMLTTQPMDHHFPAAAPPHLTPWCLFVGGDCWGGGGRSDSVRFVEHGLFWRFFFVS